MPTRLPNTDREPDINLQIHLPGLQRGDPVVVNSDRYQGPGFISDRTEWGSQFVFTYADTTPVVFCIAVEIPNGTVHLYPPEAVYRSVVLPDPIPKTWEEFEWPPWVPEKVRNQVEDFHSSQQRHNPRHWHENATRSHVGHAPFGSYVSAVPVSKSVPVSESERVEGRWVPAWNNIGRVVEDDGEATVASTGNLVVISRMDLHPGADERI